METYVKSVNLSKKFGDYIAVNKVNLDVKKGEIYGFLGPNGAGKTTTIRMLTGSLNPSEGEVYICGLPLKRKRNRNKENDRRYSR
jgi:ABC-type multidrug transport system, ATPase component